MTSRPKPQFYILFMLVSFASVGTVIFTPGLPAIAKFFDISVPHSQWTVMFYLFGYAFGELPYGPIANRFSRKIAIRIGSTIAILGSVFCILSGVIYFFPLLLIGLFIMALGAAVGLGSGLAIIADCYDAEKQTTLTAKMFMSFAAMPALAVVLGGFLVHYVGWQSSFCVYALYALFIFLLSIRLPAVTESRDHQAFKLSHIIEVYKTPLTNIPFVCGSLILAAATTFVYFYAAQAPLISMTIIGLHPHEYGLLSLFPYLGLLLGSLASHKLTARFGSVGTIWIGFTIALLAVLVMLISFLSGFVMITTLFLPMLALFFTVPAIFANAAAISFSYAKNKSNASAILNFINMILSFAGVFVFSLMNIKSALVFPIALLVAIVLIAILTARIRVIH